MSRVAKIEGAFYHKIYSSKNNLKRNVYYEEVLKNTLVQKFILKGFQQKTIPQFLIFLLNDLSLF